MTSLWQRYRIERASGAGTADSCLCMEGMPAAVPGYSLSDWGNLAYLGLFGAVLGFVLVLRGNPGDRTVTGQSVINFVPIGAIGLAHVS